MELPAKGEVLTPGEAARMFNVTVKTLGMWTRRGLLRSFQNPGPNGHHRYYRSDIEALLAERTTTRRTS